MAPVAETATRRRKREETRHKLLDSALSVFSRHGYDRATVDEIVREAGFSKGAFYVHFESKEDLFWAMLEQRINLAQDAFRQSLKPGSGVAENLQAVLSRLFAFSAADPQWGAMFLEFIAHGARNEKVREKLARMYHSWRDVTVEALTLAQNSGTIRKDIDLDLIASALIAVVEGSITQSRLAPDSVHLDKMAEPLSRLLAQWLEP